MGDCITNSYSYNNSVIKATSTEVLYVGDSYECLEICTNTRLTEVQEKLIEKVCELANTTDVSTILLPECLRIAFGSTDPTIINFLQFILNEYCSLQDYVNSIQDGTVQIENFDPVFTVEYGCCSDNPCIVNTTVKLSEHIQNILSCLCALRADVTALESRVEDLETTTESLQTQYNTLNTTVASILLKTSCLPNC